MSLSLHLKHFKRSHSPVDLRPADYYDPTLEKKLKGEKNKKINTNYVFRFEVHHDASFVVYMHGERNKLIWFLYSELEWAQTK
jgi:hypothetical protein